MNPFLRSIVRVATIGLGVAFAMVPRVVSAIDLVVPGTSANTEGDSANRFPFSLDNDVPFVFSMRYQQVYGASAFSGITGPGTITQIAFRVDQGESAFAATLSGVRIDLSTTTRPVDGLSSTFANNLGTNTTTVFNGPLSLSSVGATGNGPAPFDVVINLTTPFIYDPAVGNLLLDVRNFNGGFTRFLDSSTATNDATSRVYALDVNSSVASTEFPSDGLITRFRFATVTVPEPASLPLVAGGLFALSGVLIVRRARR